LPTTVLILVIRVTRFLNIGGALRRRRASFRLTVGGVLLDQRTCCVVILAVAEIPPLLLARVNEIDPKMLTPAHWLEAVCCAA
jgi:hypothetical protein